MATRKKAKGKAKRKKTPVTKAATRKKTMTVRKTKTVRKKAAKKAPPRRALPKKARPTAAVEPTPVAHRRPERRTDPSQPAQSAPSEERIGVVTHYYSHLSVATVRLASGMLRVGDMIHIRGHTTDFSQKVSPSRLIMRQRLKWGRTAISASRWSSTRASTTSCLKCVREESLDTQARN